MSKVIIGLAGKAGCGKDTAAEYMGWKHNFRSYAFAEPIKHALTSMFHIDFVSMPREDKEESLGFIEASPRYLMQTLGTEWGRDLIDSDLWIKIIDKEIKESPLTKFVITDVRFPNEVKWLHSVGGILFYIDRPGLEAVQQHTSETSISADHADHVIKNYGSYDDFHEEINYALSSYISI